MSKGGTGIYQANIKQFSYQSQVFMPEFDKVIQKLERLEKYLKRDMPRIVGQENVNYFAENFEKQGFFVSLLNWV